MRNIINISLPKEMVSQIKAGAKEGKFASTSEYILHVIRAYNAERLYKIIQEGDREIREGKAKRLRSFKDLR